MNVLNNMDFVRVGPQCSGFNPKIERSLDRIRWIVIHYTGCNGSAHEVARSLSRANSRASTHFICDEYAAINTLPLTRIAWHISDAKPQSIYSRWPGGYVHALGLSLHRRGCSNAASIGVDVCTRNVGTKFAPVWELLGVKHAVKLVASLMNDLSISPEMVVRHFDVTGKPCPWPWAEDCTGWLEFKRLLSEETFDAEQR